MQMRKVLDFEDEVNTDIVMAQAIQIMDSASYRLVNSINLDSSYPLGKDKLGRALNMSSPKEPGLRGFPAEDDASGKAMGTRVCA